MAGPRESIDPPLSVRLLAFLRAILTRFLPVYLGYLLLAALITFPLITPDVFASRFAGDFTGDTYEGARHIWWYSYAIPRGLSPWDQTLLAYPDGLPGWYLWGIPLRTFPAFVFAWLLPLPAAWNLTLLLRLALNGYAMFWVLRRWTGSTPAAVLGSTVFLALPAVQGHVFGGHLDLLALWGVPLYAHALWSLCGEPVTQRGKEAKAQSPTETPDTIDSAPAHPASRITHYTPLLPALWFIVSLLGSFVLAVYVLLPLTAGFVLWRLWVRDWGALRRTAAALVLGVLGTSVFIVPAALELLSTRVGQVGGSVRYSADLLALVTPSFLHPLWGRMDYTHQVLGVNLSEGVGYVGIVAGLLALIGAWRVRAARVWLLVAALAWVGSLGPLLNVLGQPLVLPLGDGYTSYLPLPWALAQNLPVLNVSRTPGRFLITVGLAVAVLSGYGAAVLVNAVTRMRTTTEGQDHTAQAQQGSGAEAAADHGRPTGRSHPALRTQYFVLVFVLCLLIVADYQTAAPLPTVPGVVPAGITALAGRPDLRAVFTVPARHLLAAKQALWLQTGHHLPLIAGQVTRQTPVNPALLEVLEATLDPALLHQAGADIVIVQRGFDPDGVLVARAVARLGPPLWEDADYAVFAVGEGGTLPAEPVLAAQQVVVHNEGELALYAPQPGWLALYVADEFRSGPIRNAQVVLNGVVVSAQQNVFGENYMPIASAGYHMLRLEALERLPESQDGFNWPLFLGANSAPVLGPRFVPDTFAAPVMFDRGVTLRGAQVVSDTLDDVTLLLWWQFADGSRDTDVRFIKVLDARGEQVIGFDDSLGLLSAGTQRAETHHFVVDGLPPGEYHVYVGWYSYPDLARFAVRSGGDVRAQDGLALVGTITIP